MTTSLIAMRLSLYHSPHQYGAPNDDWTKLTGPCMTTVNSPLPLEPSCSQPIMARDEAFSPDVDDVHMDDDDDIPRASKKDKGKGKANGAVSSSKRTPVLQSDQLGRDADVGRGVCKTMGRVRRRRRGRTAVYRRKAVGTRTTETVGSPSGLRFIAHKQGSGF